MATITISLNSTPLTGSRTYTLSDADVTRWVNAYKSIYAAQNLTLNDAQTLSRWADNVISETKRLVLETEAQNLYKTATPIAIS